jgi:hypothetical protein
VSTADWPEGTFFKLSDVFDAAFPRQADTAWMLAPASYDGPLQGFINES